MSRFYYISKGFRYISKKNKKFLSIYKSESLFLSYASRLRFFCDLKNEKSRNGGKIMDTKIMGILDQASVINSIGAYGSIGNIYQTGKSFSNILQNQMVNRMKQEIYNRFQIAVGGYSDTFSCYIPSDVLSRMNTDEALKEKVFHTLEKYSGEEFKESFMGTAITFSAKFEKISLFS